METGTAVVAIGVLIALFGYLETIRRDLRGEIKDVRQASENAHKSILTDLGNAKAERASISERLKCVEDKVDDIKQGRSSD